MKENVNILLLEDEIRDAALITRVLRQGGLSFQLRRVERREDFQQELVQQRPDLILSDHGLAAFDSLAALSLARQQCPGIPFIVVTGSSSDQMTLKALERGADACVSKEQLVQLLPNVRRTLAAAENRAERASMERQLHQSQALYRILVESALDSAIYLLDADGFVSSWNQGAEQIEGYQADEIIGQPLHTFFTPEDVARGVPDRELERARHEGKSRSQGCNVRKDGSRYLADWTLTAVRDERGNVSGFVKISRDVTELKEARESARASEERFRLAIEEVQDYAIYMLDAEGRVATYNLGAERLEGYKPEEIIGKPLRTFFTIEDVARGVPEQELARARTEGRSQTEGWNVRKDGSRFLSNWVLSRVRNQQGEVTGFSKVAHNVTELRQTEERIRRWNGELEDQVAERTRELKAINQEMEAFNYSVSHDLRSPLRHIQAFLGLLEESLGGNIPEQTREYLAIVRSSAHHMCDLVDDLLTFARVGRQEIRRVPVSLAYLVEAARTQWDPELRGREIQWVIGDLPMVEGDPILLRQVFINLLSNALKYSATRPVARIEIGCKDTDEETICYVRDNGVGFDMQHAQKLFGVFQRLHSAREFEGTGIGLAIVRRIIDRHGGRTWAEAALDQGATFYFSLPKTRS